jgi:hypothetical protein
MPSEMAHEGSRYVSDPYVCVTYNFLINVVYMRKCSDFDGFTRLNILSTADYEKVGFGMLPVSLSVCFCASLVPARLDEFYSLSAHKNLCIIGRCPVTTNILVPKIEALHRRIQTHNSLRKRL